MNTYTPNATAKKDFKASCRHVVRAGERVYTFKERALSYREATYAGTWRVRRTWCAPCAERRGAEAAPPEPCEVCGHISYGLRQGKCPACFEQATRMMAERTWAADARLARETRKARLRYKAEQVRLYRGNFNPALEGKWAARGDNEPEPCEGRGGNANGNTLCAECQR